jgi:hypothetical protein
MQDYGTQPLGRGDDNFHAVARASPRRRLSGSD